MTHFAPQAFYAVRCNGCVPSAVAHLGLSRGSNLILAFPGLGLQQLLLRSCNVHLRWLDYLLIIIAMQLSLRYYQCFASSLPRGAGQIEARF